MFLKLNEIIIINREQSTKYSNYIITLFLNLLLPIIKKLNIAILMYTKQTTSNHKPKALLDDINKYQAEECRS